MVYTRQLDIGMSGADVKELQRFLNAQGFQVAPAGQAGSPGNETEYFGQATQKALQAFQASKGIVSSGTPTTTGYGRVGSKTLNALNAEQSVFNRQLDVNGVFQGIPAVDTVGMPQDGVRPFLPPQTQQPSASSTKGIGPVKSGEEYGRMLAGLPATPTTSPTVQPPLVQPPPAEPSTGVSSEDPAVAPEITPPPPAISPAQTERDTLFNDLYNQMIQNDPFLAEQLKDPTKKAMFDSLSIEAKSAYLQTLSSLGKTIEAGKVVNPAIEITPEQTQKFVAQASEELDPYYKEQMGLLKRDIDTSFKRLQDDYTKSVQRAEEPFKESLATRAEAEAQAGTTFGSERAKRERRLVLGQGEALGDVATQFQRGVEDIATKGERTLGSELFGGVSVPGVQEYGATTRGFTPTRTITFTPQGGLIGSEPKKQETARIARQQELERAYRANRALNLTGL